MPFWKFEEGGFLDIPFPDTYIRKKAKRLPFRRLLYDRWLAKTNLDHKNGRETKTLLKESITAMALPDHPLFAERDTLSLTELAEQPLILSNRYRKYMLSAFEHAILEI